MAAPSTAHRRRVGTGDDRERLAIICTGVGATGGIERATEQLTLAAARLLGLGATSLATVWRPEEWPSDVVAIDAGEAPARRVSLVRKVTMSARCLAWAVRRRGSGAVIIATHVSLAPVAACMGRLTGGKVAVWCHGIEVWGPLGLAQRMALQRMDVILSGSRFTAEQLIRNGVPAQRVVLLRYPTPPLRPAPGVARSPDPVVLCVARLTSVDAYKGIDTLLTAWPAVVRAHPAARLMIVGDGDARARLEAIAERLFVRHSVDFTGRVSSEELAAAYASASVFALPGRARLGRRPEGEGFGLVFLEAASAGLPTVAGRAAGAAEAVDDGVTGFLVDPNDPRETATAICKLLADRDVAMRMGEAGRERAATEFSTARFERDVADVLARLERR